MLATLDRTNDTTGSDALDRLVSLAADAAMRGAADWLRREGRPNVDAGALCARLRALTLDRFEAALSDLREATEARMEAVGLATFRATFALVGVEAARAAVGAHECR